jgi:hypothetical protein
VLGDEEDLVAREEALEPVLRPAAHDRDGHAGQGREIGDELDGIGVGPRLLGRAREGNERPVEIAEDTERRMASDRHPDLGVHCAAKLLVHHREIDTTRR